MNASRTSWNLTRTTENVQRSSGHSFSVCPSVFVPVQYSWHGHVNALNTYIMHAACVNGEPPRLYNGISKPLNALVNENTKLIEMQSNAVAATPTK